jgi:hypothetical protein
MNTRVPLLVLTTVSLLFCFACGGGSISNTKTPTTYTIGGTLTGLASGATVVLANNGGNNLSLTANGNFTFTTAITAGGAYNVTVATQPTDQNCTVSSGTGTANANVTTVSVTCSTTDFTIGGTLSGLASGATVVLQDNLGDNLTLTANGTFTFATPLATGTPYSVTVLTPPTGQTCTVANGTGTVGTANVTNVSVTCSAVLVTYSIGGTLSGLASGMSIVLQDNGGDNLTLAANGPFTFATKLAAGSAYSVSVLTQPTGQSCTVTNGSGTVSGTVSNVGVACISNYTISGNLTGLGIGMSVTLADNGSADSLTLTANGPFTFNKSIAAGSPYAVTVTTQPTGQTCTVTNGTGTANANVTNVAVNCVNTTFTIGGTLSGLGTGLNVVLADNGSFDTLTLTANGSFTFPKGLTTGSAYAVTITTQPSGQTCIVTNGTGTVGTANVTNVGVSCANTQTYTIGGTVSGLGTGLNVVLADNGSFDSLTVSANGPFTFAKTLATNATYSVTVTTQPTGQICTVSNGSGTVGITNITNILVTCANGSGFTIGGTLYDLSTSKNTTGVTLQDNSTDNLTLTANGTFTFATPVSGPYSVTVLTQPTKPSQTCTVSNGSGTATANVTNVVVVCISEWTWINGADVVAVGGIYPGNSNGNPLEPGTRYGENTWTDANGNFWMFGGIGYDINGPTVNQTSGGGAEAVLSDLWEWNGSTWSFVNGQASNGQCFAYPTAVGQAGTPSARSDSLSWIDAAGNLWMFGGYVADNVTGFCPSADPFNDIWEYTPSTNTWVWQGPLASSTQNQPGIYNGVGNVGTPGARYWSTGAQDAAGNMWMFGGYGFDGASGEGYMNDLWEWNGSAMTWTWISGSSTFGAKGVYSGGSSVPGARVGANAWFDSSGNFWIFGGIAYDSKGNVGEMNDLWEFNPSTKAWTFVSGSTTNDVAADYGTQGVPASTNVPGSRAWATSWAAPNGDVWVLGGQGIGGRFLNDLWKYSGSTNEWTWMDGSQTADQVGIYTGSASALAPGSRQEGGAFTDLNGNLWLFGGFGYGLLPPQFQNLHSGTDSLQDLWEFQP